MILYKVNKILGIRVDTFLFDFVNFNEKYFFHIVDYYKGEANRNQAIFSEMDRLEAVSLEIITGFQNNKTSFDNLKDWEVLEMVEEARAGIQMMFKVSKFLRSSIVLATYNNGIQNKDYMLKQGQYLEGVAWAELKSDDPNNDWTDISIDNNLNEESYTPRGLINLKLNYVNQGTVNDIKVVVDNITGENILGKDILQKLTFYDVGDNTDDLMVLEPRDTVIQASSILLNLSKNDNPEFWEDGIPSNLLGNTGTAFAYPIFFRELANIFSTDDTISSFQLNEIKLKSDVIFMEMEIMPILGDMILGELSL